MLKKIGIYEYLIDYPRYVFLYKNGDLTMDFIDTRTKEAVSDEIGIDINNLKPFKDLDSLKFEEDVEDFSIKENKIIIKKSNGKYYQLELTGEQLISIKKKEIESDGDLIDFNQSDFPRYVSAEIEKCPALPGDGEYAFLPIHVLGTDHDDVGDEEIFLEPKQIGRKIKRVNGSLSITDRGFLSFEFYDGVNFGTDYIFENADMLFDVTREDLNLEDKIMEYMYLEKMGVVFYLPNEKIVDVYFYLMGQYWTLVTETI